MEEMAALANEVALSTFSRQTKSLSRQTKSLSNFLDKQSNFLLKSRFKTKSLFRQTKSFSRQTKSLSTFLDKQSHFLDELTTKRNCITQFRLIRQPSCECLLNRPKAVTPR